MRETKREKERERYEIVKTQKWYYLHNMRSAYFPINSRIHRQRLRERQRERESERNKEREREREM